MVGRGCLQDFTEGKGGLVLFSVLKNNISPMFITEDVTKKFQQQVVVVNEIREIFVMSEDVFDAIRSGFAGGIMGFPSSGEHDAVPIGVLEFLNIMVE